MLGPTNIFDLYTVKKTVIPEIEKLTWRPRDMEGTFTKYDGDWAGRVMVQDGDDEPRAGDHLLLTTKAGKTKETRVTGLLNTFDNDDDGVAHIVSFPDRSYEEYIQKLTAKIYDYLRRGMVKLAVQQLTNQGYPVKQAKKVVDMIEEMGNEIVPQSKRFDPYPEYKSDGSQYDEKFKDKEITDKIFPAIIKATRPIEEFSGIFKKFSGNWEGLVSLKDKNAIRPRLGDILYLKARMGKPQEFRVGKTLAEYDSKYHDGVDYIVSFYEDKPNNVYMQLQIHTLYDFIKKGERSSMKTAMRILQYYGFTSKHAKIALDVISDWAKKIFPRGLV